MYTEEKMTRLVDVFPQSFRAQAILETMLVDLLVYQDLSGEPLETRMRRLAEALEATYARRMERVAESDRV